MGVETRSVPGRCLDPRLPETPQGTAQTGTIWHYFAGTAPHALPTSVRIMLQYLGNKQN